ncbi:hypothetical protein TTHERM_00670680 (macronuclear) [Tetrahymena thermophila SB210]|uniref:Uncharacterized protein n=1 Tax=Tetrahymena thermophila (strain SB210) TaxID=312017 RepID=I7MAU1_TETTS|nr:hypothetical protein TTHERM_00670680 [Tetrahymena thermophila SB210]EAS06144.2 hypothetical protein TTHERM_00670680 [Tetrahymena thermophila SB210]|eukprot:XP_001026389.2 hypothetical protein TTHERM_00670680 [Tetrahymena thermophila SB210]
MRHQAQHQQVNNIPFTQSLQHQQNSVLGQLQDQGAYVQQQEQPFMKQMKQKSSSPQPQGSNYQNQAVPFGNQINNQKNLSLRGNSTHNYYPQPYQRANTQVTSSQQYQVGQVPNPNMANSMITGYISPSKISPKNQLQLLQQNSAQQSYQSQQQGNQQQPQAWRRNTYQGGSTQPYKQAPTEMYQQQITTPMKAFPDPQQAQFKITQSKKVMQNFHIYFYSQQSSKVISLNHSRNKN